MLQSSILSERQETTIFVQELVRNYFPGGLLLVLNAVDPSYFEHFFRDLKITYFQSAILLFSNYDVSFNFGGLSRPNKVENLLIFFLDEVIWNWEHGRLVN